MPDLPENPTMTDLVRHRHDTGAFGGAHFRLDERQMAKLRTLAKPEPPPFPAPMGDIMGIPLVIDAELPANVWRLVDRDGTVLYEGTTDA